jgi:hypothetical protein
MSYILTTSSSTVNEGSNVTITVLTTGLPNGSVVPYSISGSGIDLADFDGRSALTGSFIITGNRGTVTLFLKRDSKTELSETFTLTLTGTGNNESISVIVNDTSQTTSVGNFYITSPTSVVSEGDTARFDIRATGILSGTVVPYILLGISEDDIIGGVPGSGTLTFLSGNVTGETYANISLVINEDFLLEGPESIVLLIQPDFPYNLEISSTITINDTSLTLAPQYNIVANKTTVIEGDNVIFTLFVENLPEGTVVPWVIQPYGTTTLNIADFKNLSNLTGVFPPLVANTLINANVATLTISTRDDFVFEQSEFFYLAVPNTFSTSEVIKILDSGNTFVTVDDTFTGNITIKILDSAILKANLGSVARSISYWEDTTGLLSENMVLQGKTPYAEEDSLAFYHPFSYVIQSKISIEKWRDSIKSLLHPAGMTIFGEINNETSPLEMSNLSVKVASETEIVEQDFLTVDDSINVASNTFNGFGVSASSISLSL